MEKDTLEVLTGFVGVIVIPFLALQMTKLYVSGVCYVESLSSAKF